MLSAVVQWCPCKSTMSSTAKTVASLVKVAYVSRAFIALIDDEQMTNKTLLVVHRYPFKDINVGTRAALERKQRSKQHWKEESPPQTHWKSKWPSGCYEEKAFYAISSLVKFLSVRYSKIDRMGRDSAEVEEKIADASINKLLTDKAAQKADLFLWNNIQCPKIQQSAAAAQTADSHSVQHFSA